MRPSLFAGLLARRGLLTKRLLGGIKQKGFHWSEASTAKEQVVLGEYLATLNEETAGNALVDDDKNSADGAGGDAGQEEASGSGSEKKRWGIRWFRGLRRDLDQRLPHYASDWRDGLSSKSLAAVLFLLPAVLMPAVAFGVIANLITGGAITVPGYIVGCGVAGMLYSVFSGQPMTFIGPTGLTLAFMVALHQFCQTFALPFMAMYSWVGVWTSALLFLLAAGGAPALIKHCTQFTDDVFNSLLALNFMYEASNTLWRSAAAAGANAAAPIMSLNLTMLTFALIRSATGIPQSPFGTRKLRKVVGDFGPALVIVAMTALCSLPAVSRLGVETMAGSIPSAVSGFSWSFITERLAGMAAVPLWAKFGCAVPAAFLTALFFLDQNISSRIVNSPRHKMKKGAAYNVDTAALSGITMLLSLTGLPWMCATTVQSLNHVSAMTDYAEKGEESEGDADGAGEGKIRETSVLMHHTEREGSLASASTRSANRRVAKSIVETRLTGFLIHAGVLSSVFALPLLGLIPVPVVAGIFFVLGRTVMSGNDFLYRIKELCKDSKFLESDAFVRQVGYKTTAKYTAIQVACLAGLWSVKSFNSTALFFPSVIGVLVLIRKFLLPRLFLREDLVVLDQPAA